MKIFSTEWLTKLESILKNKNKAVLTWGYAAGFTSSYGSTNTRIVNLTGGTQSGDWNTYFTIAQSSTLGMTMIANKKFMLDIHLSANITGSSVTGISVNSTQLTTNYDSVNEAHKATVNSGYTEMTGGSGSRIINVGDVLRIHGATSALIADSYFGLIFKIDEAV